MPHAAAATPQLLRRVNAQAVLRHIRGADVATGTELMALTGLTRASVIAVCEDLIGRGWIVELDQPPRRTLAGSAEGPPGPALCLQPGGGLRAGPRHWRRDHHRRRGRPPRHGDRPFQRELPRGGHPRAGADRRRRSRLPPGAGSRGSRPGQGPGRRRRDRRAGGPGRQRSGDAAVLEPVRRRAPLCAEGAARLDGAPGERRQPGRAR